MPYEPGRSDLVADKPAGCVVKGRLKEFLFFDNRSNLSYFYNWITQINLWDKKYFFLDG